MAILLLSFNAKAAPVKEMQTLKGCTFVKTDWADGDSFQIKTEAGALHTIRLYGVDCVEVHINTDSDKRRLRDQRRYFGITDVKGTATNPVELAISCGKRASLFTSQQLQKPFIVHTRMNKAPGDGKHVRFYAFVELSNGSDLASELIRNGLARARDSAIDGPGDRTAERYKANLLDIEMQAAKRAVGLWEFTDWNRLPGERDEQRKEDEEDQEAAAPPLPKDFRLNPNTASREDLDRLPGIGLKLAECILETREEVEFKDADDLKQVKGIKEGTLKKFEQYLDFTKE